MKPVTLRTPRLVLDQPVASDRDRIVEYCRDPVFERFMTLPWPYEPKHADFFIDELAPQGWESGDELTWAIRESQGGPLLGALGWRKPTNDIGYWLGAPHRGKGYMTEAVCGVADHLFSSLGLESIVWECVVGNAASAGVARAAGFHFTGTGPSRLGFRDGSHPLAWHGILAAVDRERKDGWPTAP